MRARATRWAAAATVAALCITIPGYPEQRLSPSTVQSTRIVDRDGRLLYEARSAQGGYAHWVSLDDIPQDVKLATLSGEDAAFFAHPGVDFFGITRAVWLNLREGRLGYGGSTITQQLAGVLDPQPPRTVRGKLTETWDAVRLEAALSKHEILEQYLNRVYYGRQAYGIEAAARRFFDKPASELTLDEAALLAILPRGPSAYDPDRNPEAARRRRRHVLQKMVERGWIGAGEAQRAAVAPIELAETPRNRPHARHVIDYVRSRGLVPEGAGEVRLGIDLALQRRLTQRVRMHLRDVEDRAVEQAGIVVLDNDSGEVLAMVGSRRYGEQDVAGSVNATVAERHPGSSLKPFVYALAVEDGAHPSTPVLDVPTEWKGYHPRAATRRYRGIVPMREALGGSLNVPAVRTSERQGVGALARLLREAGLETIEEDPERHGLALALGAAPVRLLELAGAYAMLARGGRWVEPALVRGGQGTQPRRVLSEPTAYLVSTMLSDRTARRAEFGFETPLDLPFPVAVKTGTSQSFCDNVVVGYTPEVTVAVWVGNFDGRPMQGLLSLEGAAPLWRDAMLAAMEGRPRRGFARPEGVETVEVCPLSGKRRGPHCPHGRHEEVAAARAPQDACDWHDARGVKLPPEAAAHADVLAEDARLPGREAAPRTLEGAAASDEPVRILSPAADATIVVDPVLSRASQRVPLRAAVAAEGAERVRWEIDGRAIDTVGPPYAASWAPRPGVHRIRAVALGADGEVTAAQTIRVERAARGSATE